MLKKIIVFGGSKGLGKEIAKRLKGKKTIIELVSRNKNNLLKIKKEYAHQNIQINTCDVTSESQIKKFFLKKNKEDISLESIICNVGSGKQTKGYILNKKDWNKCIEENFYSVSNIIENYLRYFKNKKFCKFIIISSIASEFKGGAPLSYSLVKNLLSNYVNIIAKDLYKHKILINTISPGHILAESNNWDKIRSTNLSKFNKVKKSIAAKRFCYPSDIVNYIEYLINKDKNYIIGTNLKIDGITE
tara:strand:+ start:1289 stop:2026 length:738 start_codon:yes stop_codon:yes gene_type:complete